MHSHIVERGCVLLGDSPAAGVSERYMIWEDFYFRFSSLKRDELDYPIVIYYSIHGQCSWGNNCKTSLKPAQHITRSFCVSLRTSNTGIPTLVHDRLSTRAFYG